MILVVFYLGLVIAVYVFVHFCVWGMVVVKEGGGGEQCVHSEFVNKYVCMHEFGRNLVFVLPANLTAIVMSLLSVYGWYFMHCEG